MSEAIRLDAIRTDGGTQSRVGLNQQTIQNYMNAMSEGDVFPAIEVIYDGEQYWCIDGFHRVEAARRLDWKEFPADVKPGTLEDAQWASYGANPTHGLARSNDDKRRAIAAALKHPRGAGMSDRQIAKHVHVDHKTVGVVRAMLIAGGEIPQVNERNGADGKSYKYQERHWGLSGGTGFWHLVERFGLDKLTVLEQLQAGATRLTDLTLSKEESFDQLERLARQKLLKLYPPDSHVIHLATKRVARVVGHKPSSLEVEDLKNGADYWATNGLAAATDAEIEAYTKPSQQMVTAEQLEAALKKVHEVSGQRNEEFVWRGVADFASQAIQDAIEIAIGLGLLDQINQHSMLSVRVTEKGRARLNGIPYQPTDQQAKQSALAAPAKFSVGDRVITRAGHEGEVVEVNGNRHVMVETANGTSRHDPATLKPGLQAVQVETPAPLNASDCENAVVNAVGLLIRLTQSNPQAFNWDDSYSYVAGWLESIATERQQRIDALMKQ